MMNHNHKLSILFFFVIGSFFLLFSQDPSSINMTSNEFVDQRTFFFIPNFLDVISNLPFMYVGLKAIAYLSKHPQQEAKYSWWVLFFGVLLVTFGSSFYHWHPTDHTLLWDRIPMTFGFMGLLTAFLSEFVDSRFDKWLLLPLLIIGVVSVLLWYFLNDIRLYVWVQFFPLALVPIILLLFSSPYTHKYYLLYALGFYVLAKLTEYWDKRIYTLTFDLVSGHTLKHLLAAVSAYYILLMLKKRQRRTSY
ncbi:MAG: ceramidase domain-containing protein [Bdellovibrionales bacterium]|nr:ceramidase domain-containing protein [Bdellovibrionales bacterium]